MTSTETKTFQRKGFVVARVLVYALYVYVLIVEVILALGFVLKLAGADPSAPFAEWVYRSLDRTMAPFRGLFSSVVIGTTPNAVDSVLDTSILFAMLVYGILLLALQAVIGWLGGRVDALDREHQTAAISASLAEAMVSPSVTVTTSLPGTMPVTGIPGAPVPQPATATPPDGSPRVPPR
jgi:hypothetical protein